MQQTLKSESPVSAVKSPAISPVVDRIESEFKARNHKRSQSQQLSFSHKIKSADELIWTQNKTDDTSNDSSSAISHHRRSISKDQMKKFPRKIPFPLLTSKTMYMNKKVNRLKTQLEVVEDTDEKNSTSQCTSAQRNNLKDTVKSKEDHKTRQSRDFFNDNEIDVSIGFHEDDVNLDQNTPLKTINIPQQKDLSEPSALNLNESEFDWNGESWDIIEREESYLGKSQFFKQNELSQSIIQKPEENPESKLPNSPVLINWSSLKVRYDQGIEQIDEVNEHSNSMIEHSYEEAKIKMTAIKSSTAKKAAHENEDPGTISKFFNSVEDLKDIQFENSQIPTRKNSEMGDLYQIHDKLSYKNKKKSKDQDNSFDLDLRKSFSDKSNEVQDEENYINESVLNQFATDHKRASLKYDANYDHSNRGSLSNAVIHLFIFF